MDKQCITEHGVAVIGVGIAGGVRIRDINATNSYGDIIWSLKGFVSRRTIEIDNTEQLTWDSVLKRTDIDILIICTENTTHEELVRQGLEHNKHVLVEFPLALSSNVATELYQLAESKGLILHEENIALLNDFKDELEASVRWKTADISLSSGFHSKIEDTSKSELPFIANISLIETVYHLCGNVRVTGGEFISSNDGFTATAQLQTSDERKVIVTLKRSKENPSRSKVIKFELEDGSDLVYKPKQPKSSNSTSQAKAPVGLFMQDFLIFMNKVHQKHNSKTDKVRTIRSLEIAEEIHALIMK